MKVKITSLMPWGLLIVSMWLGFNLNTIFFSPDGNFTLSNNLGYYGSGIIMLLGVAVGLAYSITKRLK